MGSLVVQEVKYAFKNLSIEGFFNKILISLIPIVDNLQIFSQFQPINLKFDDVQSYY